MRLRVHVEVTSPERRFLSAAEYRLDASTPLTFGRSGDQNRLVLPDERRMVSSRHGCIEARSDGVWVVDLGSRNGTTIDGRTVDGSGALLSDGAVIAVGDFRLRVEFVAPGATTIDPPDAKFGATLVHFDPEHEAAEAWETLCQQFAQARDMLPAERRAMMLDGLRARAQSLMPKQLRAVLQALLVRAGARVPEPPPDPADDLRRACGDALQTLAKNLLADARIGDAAEAKRFVALLASFVELTIGWLVQTMRARSQFEDEFGAEVTMVFDRSNNPLKKQEGKELAKSLLDWSSGRDLDNVRGQLEGVYRDLTQHQLGLLVGVKEAIGAVMERLAPDAIEAMAQKDAGWLSSKGAKAWELYRTVYRDFLQEKSKLFHEVISPAIRKGYLGAHDGDAAPAG